MAAYRLTAKNRDQLRNPTLGNRVWATFPFFTRPTFTNFFMPVTYSRGSVLLWRQFSSCNLNEALVKIFFKVVAQLYVKRHSKRFAVGEPS